MNGSMTASRLRIILSVSIALVIVAITGGFLYAQRGLGNYAAQISTMNADAQSGDTNIQTLRGLQTRLEQEQSTIASARSIVADGNTFSDQVVGDITRIANESKVNITSFEFIESATSGTTAAPTTTTPGGSAQPTPISTGGVTKKVVSVTLESPLPYAQLMDFIRRIETNDLKMQFASVTMAKEQGSNVTTQTFSIEVYVRS